MSSPILVTGAAGFLGFHVCQRLLDDGHAVIGIDNLNDYYDVSLKEARLAQLEGKADFTFEKLDIADKTAVAELFAKGEPGRVIHLAAQAGVRYSLENPQAYERSNLAGFLNVLEGCRHHAIEHLVFASSSSVYGGNTRTPFSESDPVNQPVSLYAATKKANELMAHSYAHLYGIPMTGLRFFTVYGPWGRPDMAYFGFTKALFEGETIKVFNKGDMRRDFTYVDDVVEGVVRVLEKVPGEQPPYRLFNIGNHTPVPLLEMIELLEKLTGNTAQKEFLPMQPGDVKETCADVSQLQALTGFSPSTPLEEGLRRFVDWYRDYNKV